MALASVKQSGARCCRNPHAADLRGLPRRAAAGAATDAGRAECRSRGRIDWRLCEMKPFPTTRRCSWARKADGRRGMAAARDRGVRLVTLGPRTLRADAVPVAAISVCSSCGTTSDESRQNLSRSRLWKFCVLTSPSPSETRAAPFVAARGRPARTIHPVRPDRPWPVVVAGRQAADLELAILIGPAGRDLAGERPPQVRVSRETRAQCSR